MTRMLMVALGLALATVGSMSASAAPPAAAERPAAVKVAIDLRVIHANQSGVIDPAVADVARQLGARYSGLKLLAAHQDQLVQGVEQTFTVEGNRKLKVQLLERTATAARVRVMLMAGAEKQFDTTVSLPRNKTFIVAGSKVRDGVLVFPIAVRW